MRRFRTSTRAARELQADAYADDVVDIADRPKRGKRTKTSADGKTETTHGDMVEHRKLQIDARKWAAAKLRPKKYGDRVALTGPDGGSIQTESVAAVVPINSDDSIQFYRKLINGSA